MLTVTITGNFANPVECFDFFALLAKMGVSPTVVADDRKAHPTDQVVTAEATGTMPAQQTTTDQDFAAMNGEKPNEEKVDKRKTSRKVATKEAAATVAGGEPPVPQTTAPPVNPPPQQQAPAGDEASAIQAMRDKINQMLGVKKGAQVAGLMGKYKAATVREVPADKRDSWMADADRIITGEALST